MQLEKWFATPIWYDYTIFNFDSVAKRCISISQTQPSRKLSNVGGWQSDNFDINQYVNQYDEFNPVRDILSQKIQEFSKFIGPNCKLDLDNCWLNVNYRGHHNNKHVHPLSVFSGVLYISTNDESGNIVFHNESAQIHYPDISNNASNLFFREVTYRPKNGMILLFPAWIYHSVMPNMSDEPRISIAFNIRQT